MVLCDKSCADPESFVRGGQTLTTFFFILLVYETGRVSKCQYKRANEGPTLNFGLIAL